MKQHATSQTLTETFTDIGNVIGTSTIANTTGDDAIKFSFVTLAVELEINDSKNFQVKILGIDLEDNVEFDFPINTVKKNIVEVEPLVHELKLDVDANQLFEWELDTTLDALQVQVKVGSTGVIPGVVTSLRYNLGYRQ